MMDVETVNGFENGLEKNGGEMGDGLEASATQTNGTVMMPSASVDLRIKKKARRLTKQNSKESSPNGIAVVQQPRYFKNSRRSRSGYGRGLPKKGGAGGKGVWGKPGSELAEEYVDSHDPNYDSDSMDNGEIELKTIFPVLSDEELQKAAEPIILEYFENGDTHEACISFEELHAGKKRYRLPYIAIEMAMDHKPSHRELTSVLISDMYGRIVSERDIARAFDELLRNLPDLVLDTPDAATVLANFLARAVADDCLPPRYVYDLSDLAKQTPSSPVKQDEEPKVNGLANGDANGTSHATIVTAHSRITISRAETLLSLKHGLVRLDNVWGVGGGTRPVKSLIRQMVLLLREYLSSGDLQEAARCLQELEVPHFHHELVYEAVIMTIEAVVGPTEGKMVCLLKFLSDAVIITPDMMERGIMRIFEDLDDICLDVPVAHSVLERFLENCEKAGFISHNLVRKLPTRGRKRFVSEGDGGRIKDHLY
ncbi:programmed cell death protein 4 [Neocloeon triangulifer]|uniref:programmed cell death protein 4 n=1 Tax=Neocloeon triangulifer TaxID=2078957 RepID=UPI00286F6238|nr:programmed cell death protein 4 [Neocloeon triangulifer]